MTAIDDKHQLLRSTVLDLGEPVGPEIDLADGGSMREYEFGTICFHPEVGAFEVHGLIRDTYLNDMGGPGGRLGYPTSDETGVGVGRLSTFELGESGLFFDPVSGINLIDDLGLRQLERTFSDDILAPEPVAAGPTQTLCFPPGSVAGSLRGMQFGLIAERLIHDDYCNLMGCHPANDYFDRTGSSVEYLTFLQSHNPGLRPRYREIRTWRRPDILSHQPPRFEWYEIKPLSIWGMVDFADKFVKITNYMTKHSLPYVPGVTYSPTPFLPIGTFNIVGVDIEVSLGVARRTAGLIDYQLCIRGNLVELFARIALAALVAAIIAQIVVRLAPLLAL